MAGFRGDCFTAFAVSFNLIFSMPSQTCPPNLNLHTADDGQRYGFSDRESLFVSICIIVQAALSSWPALQLEENNVHQRPSRSSPNLSAPTTMSVSRGQCGGRAEPTHTPWQRLACKFPQTKELLASVRVFVSLFI